MSATTRQESNAGLDPAWSDNRQRPRPRHITCFVCSSKWLSSSSAPVQRCDDCRAADASIERVGFCKECGEDFLFAYKGTPWRVCPPCTEARIQRSRDQDAFDRAQLHEIATRPDIPSVPTPDFGTAAVCSQIDPDLWHPGQYGSSARRAKELCRTCPFEDDCREWAILTKPAGIWGATSETDRERIIGERARAAA